MKRRKGTLLGQEIIQTVIKQYKAGRSVQQIYESTKNIGWGSVKNIINRAGISRGNSRPWDNTTRRKALRLYKSGLTIEEVAQQLSGPNRISILNWITKAGIKRPISKCRARGARHWNWQGGITDQNHILRNRIELKEWRASVFERDKWTCQQCGKIGGGTLNAHHILSWAKYSKLRYKIENGVTLCQACHKEVHGLTSNLQADRSA